MGQGLISEDDIQRAVDRLRKVFTGWGAARDGAVFFRGLE